MMCSHDSICLKTENGTPSNPFSIETVGTSGVVETIDTKSKILYSLRASCYLGEGAFNRTKIVTFCPHHVMFNQMKDRIVVLHQSELETTVELKPGEEKAYFFTVPDKCTDPRKIKRRVYITLKNKDGSERHSKDKEKAKEPKKSEEEEEEEEEVEEEGMVFCKEEAEAEHVQSHQASSAPRAPIKVTADDFQLLKVIGKGSFGKVMQVKKKDTGKIYAMKVLQKEAIINRNQVIHTRSEKSILQQVQHPFIVGLHYAFQTRDKLYMILDYVNGGELFFHLKHEGKFSESRVKFYTAEISLALAHLHKLGIVYRDLKPENILLDCDGHIVITDFGLSKQMMVPPSGDTSEATTHTFCGTPEYLAPEVLRGQGHGTPVDWWSLGTLVYEMLTGLPPFYSANTNVMYQKILSSELRFPPEMSGDCRSFLSGLLERDPAKRMDGDDVMKHPWLSSIDWDKLFKKQIPAPWKPPVSSEADTTQIDRAFLAEPVKDTPPKRCCSY